MPDNESTTKTEVVKLMGAIDEAKGRAKEAVGDVTGNDRLKGEGKVDKGKGKVKDAVDKVADKVSPE